MFQGVRRSLPVVFYNIAGQLLLILFSPIFSRLYTPADFGAYALIFSLSALFSVIATGRYEVAIPIAKTEDHAYHLAFLSTFICFFSSGFLLIIIRLISNAQLLMWLPAFVFFLGIRQALTYLSIRKDLLSYIGKSVVIQSVCTVIFNLLLYKIGVSGCLPLIASNFIGLVTSTLYLFLHFYREIILHYSATHFSHLKTGAKEFINFPKFNSLQAISDQLQTYGLNLGISHFVGVQPTGYFHFASRIIRTPLLLVGTSFSQIYVEKFSKGIRSGIVPGTLLKKTWLLLTLLGAIPFTILFFLSPFLFSVAFGEEWREAGHYTQALVPWLYIGFIYSPTSQTLVLIKKQRESMWISFFYNILILSVFLISIKETGSLITTLWTLSTTMSCFLLLLMGWIYRLTSQGEQSELPRSV